MFNLNINCNQISIQNCSCSTVRSSAPKSIMMHKLPRAGRMANIGKWWLVGLSTAMRDRESQSAASAARCFVFVLAD